MMINAYPEMYLNRAKQHLGQAFDYAINTCEISGDAFAGMLVISGFAKRFECGEPAIVKGRSGIELARDVMTDVIGEMDFPDLEENYIRSPEYWAGYVLAHFQWYSCRSFEEILTACSFSELVQMYDPLHEADISKTVEILQRRMQDFYAQTRLQHRRKLRGLSQSELARISGVGLRSIQMYEQREKDINKANAISLYKLSLVLCCSMEDLLEK